MKLLAPLLVVIAALAAFWFLRQGDVPQAPETRTSEGRQADPRADEVNLTGDALPELESLSSERSEAPSGGSTATHATGPVVPAVAGDEAAASATIRGRVTNSQGDGLAAADVTIADRTVGFGLQGRAPLNRKVDVQADGTFEITAPAGGRRLIAGSDGYAPLDRDVDLEPGSVLDLGDLRLAEGVRLTGRVRDDQGVPVEGAGIHRIRPRNGGFVVVGTLGDLAATTDATGSFVIERQAAGTYDFEVDHPHYPRASFEGTTARAGESVTGIEVTLSAGVSISGIVTGIPDGLDGLRVEARIKDTDRDVSSSFGSGEAQWKPRTGSVGEDGSFTVRGLLENASVELRLREGEAFAWKSTRRSELVSCRSGDRGVRVAYSDGATVRFRLADPDGAPILEPVIMCGFGWQNQALDTLVDEVTAQHELVNLWPSGAGADPFELGIKARGYKPYGRTDLQVRPMEVLDLGVITLEVNPQLVVRLVDELTKDPVEGARVRVREVDPSRDPNVRRVTASFEASGASEGVFRRLGSGASEATTDEEGKCSLDVKLGTFISIEVWHPKFAELLTPPADLESLRSANSSGLYESTLDLAKGGAIEVTVTDPTGALVAGASVERKKIEGAPSPTNLETDATGKIMLEGLAAGEHHLRVKRAQKSGPISVQIEGLLAEESDDLEGWTSVVVLSGETAAVALEAPIPNVLSGTITEDGVPLAGAKVKLKSKSNDFGLGMISLGDTGGTTTDARGEFVLPDVLAGEQIFVLHHSSRAMSYEQPVTIEPGENDISIDLDVTIASGTVFDPAGDPLAGAKVTIKRSKKDEGRATVMMISVSGADDAPTIVSGGGSQAKSATTNEDGRWELRGIAADSPIVAQATFNGFDAATSEEFEVRSGSTKDDIDIRFTQPGKLRINVEDAPGGMILVVLRKQEAEQREPRTEQFTGSSTTIEGLEPGTWSVRLTVLPIPGAETVEFVPEDRAVEIVAGETVTADFKAEK